jgi:uncharacterized membrane protein
MNDNKDLKNGLVILIALDVIVFTLGFLIDSFSDLFGFLLLMLMVVTGMVFSELTRRQKSGEETSDNYPEW